MKKVLAKSYKALMRLRRKKQAMEQGRLAHEVETYFDVVDRLEKLECLFSLFDNKGVPTRMLYKKALKAETKCVSSALF